MSVRVLVVDANNTTSRLIAENLGLGGVDSQTASTADEAIWYLSGGSFQVLFTELALPDRSGLEVLASARVHQPDMAAVVVSASVPAESVVEAMRLGACDFLFKPVTPQSLRSSFRRALQARARLAPGAAVQPIACHAEGTAQSAKVDDLVSVPLLRDYRKIEQHLVKATIRLFGGNKAAAAKALGMHRRTLYRVLGRYE